jgi:hypothetical protein
MFAKEFKAESRRTPLMPNAEMYQRLKDPDVEEELRRHFSEWAKKMETRLPFFESQQDGAYLREQANNIFLSQCYNCKKIAVWVHQSLVFPPTKIGVQPNADLPADIAADFEEARDILNLSQRGAAALLRLCVQKLCLFLGEKGKDIDADIASLVKKGLNPLVGDSLDVVRVIGNEAVHPGVIDDLKDDRETALKLLQIINAIADQMITHPKSVKEMFDRLPEEKRKAIAERNKKALSGDKNKKEGTP